MSKELLELEALLDLTKKKIEALKDRETYVNQRYQEEVTSLTKKEKQERIQFLEDIKSKLLDPNQQSPTYYYELLKTEYYDGEEDQLLAFIDQVRQYQNKPVVDNLEDDEIPFVQPLLDSLLGFVQYTILTKIWKIIEEEIKKLKES